MERPGKEQEAQHAVHQGDIEIDRLDQGGGMDPDVGEPDQPEADQSQRQTQGNEHLADRGRQPDVADVEIAENRGQAHQDCRDVERIHRRSKPAIAVK